MIVENITADQEAAEELRNVNEYITLATGYAVILGFGIIWLVSLFFFFIKEISYKFF